MQLAYIAPTAYLDKISAKGGILLALAHLIDDAGKNDYTKFHRRKAQEGHRIICDNGLFEGAQVDTDTLLHRAGLIGAHVVCAPDVLYNSSETIKSFKRFIKAKQDAGMVFDVMGIPQADNPVDWWECFKFMDLSSDCKLIGLSILSVPQSFNVFLGTTGITASRVWLIKQLYLYEILLGRRITPCHLLGLGESLADLIVASRLVPHSVISNDSSSAFVHGAAEVKYTPLGKIPLGKIKDKLNFSFNGPLHPEQEIAIKHNMHIAHTLVNQDWSKYA